MYNPYEFVVVFCLAEIVGILYLIFVYAIAICEDKQEKKKAGQRKRYQ